MYFTSRTVAGHMLAEKIAKKHAGTPCAVVGLGDGGVMVGAQIAQRLHAPLGMLVAAAINLPRETQAIGAITETGDFSLSNSIPRGERDEMMQEYYTYIEQEKRTRLSELHERIGPRHLIRKDLLRNRTVILTSDGMEDSLVLDVVAGFFKPIKTRRLIIATPFATVKAVDRMHVQMDEIYCMNVLEDFFTVDHYYERQDVPPHEVVAAAVEKILKHWKP